MQTVVWRGMVIFILRLLKDQHEALDRHDELLAQPNSAQSHQPVDAKNLGCFVMPEILVLIKLCMHLESVPTFRLTLSAALGDEWAGGFFCPCHGSKFDLAGQFFQNVLVPTNLVVPPFPSLPTLGCWLALIPQHEPSCEGAEP